MSCRISPAPGAQLGFALLEALLAILIFSIGVLSLVGLQAMASRYSTDAKFRSTAAYLASKCMAEIWVANPSSRASTCADAANLAELPQGTRTVSVEGDASSGYTVTVTINWQLPGDSTTHQHKTVTVVHDRCDTAGCA